MKGVSVVLRDGAQGSSDLCVNANVIRDLGVLPGDFVDCVSSGACLLVRLWPKEDIQRGVAECGRLLMSLGLTLGESLTLKKLDRPLSVVKTVHVEWDGAESGLLLLARSWLGQAVWSGATMLASKGGRTVPVGVVQVDGDRGLVGSETSVVKWNELASVNDTGNGPRSEMELRLTQAAAGSFAGLENAGHGIVLWGPPGSGKTWLARRVFAGQIVEAGSSLADAMSAALRRAPCAVLVDEAERRLGDEAATLMAALDKLPGTRVVVIVIVRRPDVLPPALRRAGRLEIEIELGHMTGAERRTLLRSLLKDERAVPESLEMAGLVAGEVAAVAREAMRAGGDQAAVLAAARAVQAASAARSGLTLAPSTIRVERATGLEEARARLAECIEWPLRHAEAFARVGVKPATGILLYGPPGNGKTLLAREVAAQMNCSFILVKGPELYSKYVGESERALAAVFAQARRQHPCVVFLDEIDALAPKRSSASSSSSGSVGERMLGVLLGQLDGVSPLRGVVVIGATNRPEQLDAALLRPGRLSHLLLVPLPDASARVALLRGALAPAPASVTDDELALFAQLDCQHCSGAECAAIVREAKMMALARAASGERPLVTLDDLKEARRMCPPRTSPETIQFYETWRNE